MHALVGNLTSELWLGASLGTYTALRLAESGLARLLVERGATDVRFQTKLHWALEVACRQVRQRPQRACGLLLAACQCPMLVIAAAAAAAAAAAVTPPVAVGWGGGAVRSQRAPRPPGRGTWPARPATPGCGRRPVRHGGGCGGAGLLTATREPPARGGDCVYFAWVSCAFTAAPQRLVLERSLRNTVAALARRPLPRHAAQATARCSSGCWSWRHRARQRSSSGARPCTQRSRRSTASTARCPSTPKAGHCRRSCTLLTPRSSAPPPPRTKAAAAAPHALPLRRCPRCGCRSFRSGRCSGSICASQPSACSRRPDPSSCTATAC
jgi:hypothetical protein